MEYFSVKNFDKFQHYKDRKPPWIKLYNDLLDDYEFAALPDASKMHLIAIWLLASRYENRIPHDTEWISRRINATENIDLDALVGAGFILLNQPLPTPEQVASKAPATCSLETEGETETKTETASNEAPPNKSEAVKLIEAFEAGRADAGCEPRAWPAATDRLIADGWLRAGIESATVQAVSHSVHAKKAAKGQSLPGSLSYIDEILRDAVQVKTATTEHRGKVKIMQMRDATDDEKRAYLIEKMGGFGAEIATAGVNHTNWPKQIPADWMPN